MFKEPIRKQTNNIAEITPNPFPNILLHENRTCKLMNSLHTLQTNKQTIILSIRGKFQEKFNTQETYRRAKELIRAKKS